MQDIGVEESCHGGLTPAGDPWSIELIWEDTTTTSELYEWGCVINAVGDLDGDGFAEIPCQGNASAGDKLIVYSSRTQLELWSTEALNGLSPMVIGDVDADGEQEIVGLNASGYIISLSIDGSVEWTSSAPVLQDGDGTSYEGRSFLEAEDIDGDGVFEIVTHTAIISGADGSLVTSFDIGKDREEGSVMPFALGPILQDGDVQLAYRGALYASDGSQLWSEPSINEETSNAVAPLLVQADTDDAAEIMWLKQGGQVLTDSDGTILSEVAYSIDLHTGGMGCAGDIDGDGWMDIITAGSTDGTGEQGIIQAHSLEGAVMWEIPLHNENSIIFASCSTFDFDLDGAREVLISTGDFFYILGGVDGEIRYSYAHNSRSAIDTPIVVDLDGDGSVEIIVPNALGHDGYYPDPTPDAGFRVFAHTERAWPPGGRIWGHANWSGVGMDSRGRATESEAAWLSTGLFRGQPTVVEEGADLRAEVVDGCVSESAAGEAGVSVRWVNGGPWTAAAGTTMALYALDKDGEHTALLEVLTLSEDLPAGYASDSIERTYPRATIGAGIEAVAGDDGTGTLGPYDCNTANNADNFTP